MAKPDKCISVEEARNLQSNWVETRAAEIKKAEGATDARDFTFSLNDLQEFLDYVKEASTEQGISNPGVRVYFGAYDSEESTKATVFLAATDGAGGDANNNYNVDPLNRGNTGWPPNDY